MSGPFRLQSPFEPKGDQPGAIAALLEGLRSGLPRQVLLGVTGSGKTFTVAKVIEAAGRPALVIAHNKTLAAQLYGEFKALFPDNAVEYFVSYYDYYQPEAYVPSSDTFIEKDASINDAIDKLRHAATRSLLERPDTIIVASVSCIYGLGSPEIYYGMTARIAAGETRDRQEFLARLVDIQYERADMDARRGTFRVRGNVVEVLPAHLADTGIRVAWDGDAVASIEEVDPLLGTVRRRLEQYTIFPASHYVTGRDRLETAMAAIALELDVRARELSAAGKLLEAERLLQRTRFDLEMLRETGYCGGIENYSRHLTGRAPGEPPPTLVDYLPKNALLIIDESHVTVPQLQGMCRGDRSRKQTLVDYGFRLPSALDNRPLTFEEFEARSPQTIYLSATPAEFEIRASKGRIAEQLIRPTGLMDPEVAVKPARGQVEDLVSEIRDRVGRGHRVLVTTLTKRMAEDLTEYLAGLGLRVRYMHAEVETLERSELLRALRAGEFDVRVGINLLREGLDLPEVSLVAILDADKEGFLRSRQSLIQTIGRAARHVDGRVVLYADVRTDSIREAIAETERRRRTQAAYNARHGITPESVKKEISTILSSIYEKDYAPVPEPEAPTLDIPLEAIPGRIAQMESRMRACAKRLDFEKAARLRDEIRRLQAADLGVRM